MIQWIYEKAVQVLVHTYQCKDRAHAVEPCAGHKEWQLKQMGPCVRLLLPVPVPGGAGAAPRPGCPRLVAGVQVLCLGCPRVTTPTGWILPLAGTSIQNIREDEQQLR